MQIARFTPKDKGFPAQLKQISDPPKQLFTLSKVPAKWTDLTMVAIVGSRRPTPYGRAITTKIAGELARRGVTIVSGLALGIDSIAHQAALDAGGHTIAVLPTHVEEIYPRSHFYLAKEILNKGGAIVSEYPTGTEPRRENFIARNRIIAGLSKIVVITEAARKSGSLHTAQFALDDGKTVMAVPGPINSAMSEGTNNLIKTGAPVITEVEDILRELEIDTKTTDRELITDNPQQQVIIELIRNGVTDSRELSIQSGLSAPEFSREITMLELAGSIRSDAGHWTIL